jgi:hypothetical protein
MGEPNQGRHQVTMSLAKSERARERWEAMTPEQKAQRVQALQEGRKKARSPERLTEIESAIDKLGVEFRLYPEGHPRRVAIIRELRPLGIARSRFQD